MANEIEKQQELTDQEKAQCDILEEEKYSQLDGKKIAELRKSGKLSESAFTDLFELMRDPNKMKEGSKYRDLLSSITNENLPDRTVLSGGKTTSIISILIKDLKEGYKPAAELIKKLSSSSNNSFSKYQEKSYLKEKSENIKKEGTGISEVLSGIHGKSAESSVTSERESNWESESLSQERREEMTELLKASTSLLRELNKKYAEFKDNPSDLLQSEIEAMEAELGAMETIFNKRDLPFFERNVQRFRALSRMTRYQGVDLKYAKKLKLNDGKYIEIIKIYFDNPEGLNLPGQLSIKYKDENGRENTMGYLVFIKNILGDDGAYEEVNSKEELDEKIAELTGNKELEVGDKFHAREYLEKNDRIVETDVEFTVLEIKDDGREGLIKLSAYGGARREEMNFGQFSKFLYRKGSIRKFNDDEDLQKALYAAAERRTLNLNEQEKALPEAWQGANPIIVPPIVLAKKGEKTRIVKNGMPGDFARAEGQDALAFTERPVIASPEGEEALVEGEEKLTETNDEDLMREVNTGAVEGAEQSAEGGEDEGEGGGPEKIATEALPFDVINKVGGMTREEKGYLKTLYANSYFLSGSDVWEMAKTMWEYYQRRQERRQKERFATVAEDAPFFSPEMKRIRQAAESEQVNQFKEELDQAGIDEVKEELRTTNNKDRMKACFTVLCEKGQMDWKDIDMWRNLNNFLDGDHYIPIPKNGDPETKISATDSRTGFDLLSDAIDSLWGSGGFNDWYSQNKGAYESGVNKFYEKGNEMENVESGFERELERLLYEHKMGGYVDPQEFEALVTYIIDNGKSIMPVKIYYMVQGVAAENPHGKTIMGFERLAHMNGKLLAKFPLMDYMTAAVARPPDGKKSKLTIDDYKKWAYEFDGGRTMNCKPNKKVEDFLWDTILQNDATQTRVEKDMREGQNIDHDDAYAFIPMLSSGMITDVCKTTTGSKKFLTVPGYKNLFPGMSHWMNSLTKTGNREQLKESIKSYVRLDAAMTNRWDKGKDGYQRLKPTQLNSKTVVSPDYSPMQYIEEMRPMINEIVAAYKDSIPGLERIGSLIFEETEGESIRPETKVKQQEIQKALEDFDTLFDKVMEVDGGNKMISLISSTKLTGMQMYKN